jgi:hypothetical protein
MASSPWGWPIRPTFWITCLLPKKTDINWLFSRDTFWEDLFLRRFSRNTYKILIVRDLFSNCLQRRACPMWPTPWEKGLTLNRMAYKLTLSWDWGGIYRPRRQVGKREAAGHAAAAVRGSTLSLPRARDHEEWCGTAWCADQIQVITLILLLKNCLKQHLFDETL